MLFGIHQHLTSLFLTTATAHWNVTGIHFLSLHKLFRKQYTQLLELLDRVSEQIRAGGKKIPVDWHEVGYSQLQEHSSANEIINTLIEDYSSLLNAIDVEKDFDDLEAPLTPSTNQVLDEVAGFAEKQRWILRSLLE